MSLEETSIRLDERGLVILGNKSLLDLIAGSAGTDTGGGEPPYVNNAGCPCYPGGGVDSGSDGNGGGGAPRPPRKPPHK